MTKNQFDAQDLTQETFLSVYRNINTFERDYEKAWITKITTNKCLDFLKSASRRLEPVENSYFSMFDDKEANPENQYLQKEAKQVVYLICDKLKDPYREIALEHFYHEKSIKEIAMEKNKGVKTIQTQVYRAKAMLKKNLEGGNHYGKRIAESSE